MRIYEAIVRYLEQLDIDTVFGGAGENAAGLMLALSGSRRLRTIITKNEQAAAFMACGYAMFSDKVGVCFATAGPGAFNLISGLSVALTDSYPLIAITGYSSLKWTGRGSLNETSGVGRTPNSQRMFDATTKKNYFIAELSQVSGVLEDAIRTVREGRPGPVHIAVNEDLTDPALEVQNFRGISISVPPVEPDPTDVEVAARVLAQALQHDRNVVMLVGFGAIRAGAGVDIRELALRYQIPVLTTLDGKGILDEKHPLAVGVFADSGHRIASELFLRANVVLAVGNSFAQHATFDFREDLLAGKTLIHVNIDPGDIDRVYPADHAIVGDAKRAIRALSAALSRHELNVPPRTYKTPEFDDQRIIQLDDERLHPGRLVQSISKMLPERGIVLADAGAHAAWLGYYLELRYGQNFRKPGTFGPMGIAVNGAIGVKLADPSRTVVAAVGDGSYLMAGFELMTAVQHDIPVIWVIFDDGEFKLIKLHQISTSFESALVEFPNPDYVRYAEACGATGYRVETIEEFDSAFAQALALHKPVLIDAAITRLAVPHYSPSPEGILAGVMDRIKARFNISRDRAPDRE